MTNSILFDKYDISELDFGEQINFKIYNDDNTPFDATFANGGSVLKTFDDDGNQIVPDIPVTWDTKNQGKGHFNYTQASRPTTAPKALYICVQMWDSPLTMQTSSTLRRIVITAQPSTN